MANRPTRIDALQIKDVSIADAQVSASAAIAISKLAAGSAGNIIVGADSTGIPTYVAMSGDTTITAAGAVAIGADKVLDTMIRLANNVNLRARNAAGNADVNILKINASDLVELNATPWADAITEAMLAITGGPTDGYYLKYVTDHMEWADIASGYVQFEDIIANEPPDGDIDGENPDFDLAQAPQSGTLQVYLNGLLQKPGGGLDYTLDTLTITFVVAPEVGDIILCNYVK